MFLCSEYHNILNDLLTTSVFSLYAILSDMSLGQTCSQVSEVQVQVKSQVSEVKSKSSLKSLRSKSKSSLKSLRSSLSQVSSL